MKPNKLILSLVTMVTMLAAAWAIAVPLPDGLSNPGQKKFLRIDYPAELQPLIQEAFWERFGDQSNESPTEADKQAVVDQRIMLYVMNEVEAHLIDHGEVTEGDSLAEKRSIVRSRIANIRSQTAANVDVTRGNSP